MALFRYSESSNDVSDDVDVDDDGNNNNKDFKISYTLYIHWLPKSL